MKLIFTVEMLKVASVPNKRLVCRCVSYSAIQFLVNNTLIVCVYFFLLIFTTDVCLICETLNSELHKLLSCK